MLVDFYVELELTVIPDLLQTARGCGGCTDAYRDIVMKLKGKGPGTCYSAAYVSQDS